MLLLSTMLTTMLVVPAPDPASRATVALSILVKMKSILTSNMVLPLKEGCRRRAARPPNRHQLAFLKSRSPHAR